MDLVLLKSLLRGIEECEGILVRRDDGRSWDDEAVARAFATFQFSAFAGMGDDDGMTFIYPESEASVLYTGSSVKIFNNENLTAVIADLMRTLNALEWRSVDVYSVNGDLLFMDLCRFMPANIEASGGLSLTQQDIPAELSEDLAGLEAAASALLAGRPVAAAGGDAFMAAVSESMGLSQGDVELGMAVRTGGGVLSAPGAPGVPIGADVNYVPDVPASRPGGAVPSSTPAAPGAGYSVAGFAALGEPLDPLDSDIPVPSVPGVGAAPVVVTGENRPRLAMATASPVAGVVEPAASEGVPTGGGQGELVVAAQDDAVVEEVTPSPAPVAAGVEPVVELQEAVADVSAAAVAPVSCAAAPSVPRDVGAQVVKPPRVGSGGDVGKLGAGEPIWSPVKVGPSVLALSCSWDAVDAGRFEQKFGLPVVRVGMGGQGMVSGRKVDAQWSLAAEIAAIGGDVSLLRGLAGALAPDALDVQLVLVGVFLGAQVLASGMGGSVGAFDVLRDVLTVEDGTLVDVMHRARDVKGNDAAESLAGTMAAFYEVCPVVMRRMDCPALATQVEGLILDWCWSGLATDRGGDVPAVTLLELAMSSGYWGQRPAVYLLEVDAMEAGGAGEFLGRAALGWARRLGATWRSFALAPVVTAEERQAAALLESVSPEVREAMLKMMGRQSGQAVG